MEGKASFTCSTSPASYIKTYILKIIQKNLIKIVSRYLDIIIDNIMCKLRENF